MARSRIPQLKNRLRRWRIDQGYSLQEMEDLTGYSAPMFSRAERGLRVFSPRARVQIARRLGVKVRDLFEVDDDPNSPEGPQP
jgi:transcriptional regulator with XRE-family HTH domain